MVDDTRLFRVEAPRFTAGAEVNSMGVIVRTAPILRYTRLWQIETLQRLCHEKGWKIEEMKWAKFRE